MNRRKRKLVQLAKKRDKAFQTGKSIDKYLILYWRAWHKLYKPKHLWGEPIASLKRENTGSRKG